MNTGKLLEHRQAKDEFFRESQESPLRRGHHPEFDGLVYFDPRADLVFTVPLAQGDLAEVAVPTSDEREKVYRRAGTVAFEVEGTPVALTVYDTVHGHFIPFRDQTSGATTYGSGRYLDIEPNDDGTITVDFNYAYNPSCVFGEGYSCPIPPLENWLPVPIEAGERMYPKAG